MKKLHLETIRFLRSDELSCMDTYHTVFVVAGNQLFPKVHLRHYRHALIFMAEDLAACTYRRHHKHKLVLILAAMRAYARALRKSGFKVHYEYLDDDAVANPVGYMDKLRKVVERYQGREIVNFEIQDTSFERRLDNFAVRHNIKHRALASPMFLTPRDAFAEWRAGRRMPRMVDFYKWQRRRLDVLVDSRGKPEGGRWSFDTENRKPLPHNLPVPTLPVFSEDEEVAAVKALVDRHFANHPGRTADFSLPTTHDQGVEWLNDFLEQRLTCFGDYEDALTTRSDAVFHSVLSPLMNVGLLTPSEVLDTTLAFADRERIAINNVEGFVRQIIGWREFMFGIYQTDGQQIRSGNFWNHRRRLSVDWYRGTTGIAPLDAVIAKANRIGWAHHIERLMIAGNLMLLAEIHPDDVYNWFSEMFIDSADWVMVPNVYAMALFADGGRITTKPYICGSNYLRKMGDYKVGEWQTTVDGLFWRFIARHREFFEAQPRLGMLCRNLDRQSPERGTRLQQAAAAFLRSKTEPVPEVA